MAKRGMDAMMAECMKPHSLLHTLMGVGLGLVLVALMPTLAASAMMLGILLVAAAVVGEFMYNK